MNKGRLFVVNENTLQNTIRDNVVSVITPNPSGQQWLKTIADIMADMLQVEIGDYIFLWETRTTNQKSRIHGVYRAISAPYYELTSPNDNAPFKIKIECAYEFQNSLDEYEVLNCPYSKTPLWTITGKKVAGKSRGTSPLSSEEVKHLITLLIGKNPDFHFIPFDAKRVIAVAHPLCIDYNNHGNNIGIHSLQDINPNMLNYFNDDYSIKYEKILETIFNQEMSSRNSAFFNQLGIQPESVIWFCNYLPYSIEQSEMDYLIVESLDGMIPSKMYLLEFMKTTIDESHIYRSLMYSKWINETLALGVTMSKPIIICAQSYDFIHGETTAVRQRALSTMENYIKKCEEEFGAQSLSIYTYDFSTGQPVFINKR